MGNLATHFHNCHIPPTDAGAATLLCITLGRLCMCRERQRERKGEEEEREGEEMEEEGGQGR